jgi:hypothetical protein
MSTIIEKFSVIKELATNHRETLLDADILLLEICHNGGKANYEQLVYFNRELGWDERAVHDQLRRMHNVTRWKAIAGNTPAREAVAKESEAAATVLEKEGPKLAAKIEELQAKLNGLERDARLSAKRCEEQAEAVQRLRELVPEHIAGEVRSAVAKIEATIGREMLDAETRANELECCLTPSKYRDERAYLEALQRSFRDAVTVITENNIIRRRLSPEWPTIREGIQAELGELRPRIETLRSQRAEMIEQAELPLGYYAG